MTSTKGFIRRTKQREMILRVLRDTDTHPTADWVYQEVRKHLPNVSLGTVYRNLKTLTEMGEALELSFGSTFSRFDGRSHNHYHFCCDMCGRVFDVEIEVRADLEREVEGEGFHVERHRLEFYGLCADCKEAAQADALPERESEVL